MYCKHAAKFMHLKECTINIKYSYRSRPIPAGILFNCYIPAGVRRYLFSSSSCGGLHSEQPHLCRPLPLTDHTTHLLVSLIIFYCRHNEYAVSHIRCIDYKLIECDRWMGRTCSCVYVTYLNQIKFIFQ